MPWYVGLVLFILAPVYTVFVRDKLWPRIQDWWAGRSRQKLERHIQELEDNLKRPYHLDDLVLLLASRFARLITSFGAAGVCSYVAIVGFRVDRLPPLLSQINSGMKEVMGISALMFYCYGLILGADMAMNIPNLLRQRSVREYKKRLALRIQELKVKLQSVSAITIGGSAREFVKTPNWRALGRLTPPGIFSA